MTELVRRDFACPVQLLAPDARSVAGVITNGALDRWGETIDPAGVRWSGGIKLLLNHDAKLPIGRAERIAVDGDKVLANFRLASPGVDETADRAHRLLQDGLLDSFSVGGIAHRWQGNKCTDFEICEVSLVSVPANPDARVTEIRSAPEGNMITTDRSGVVRVAGNSRPGAPAIRRSDPDVSTWNFGRFLAYAIDDQQSGVDWGLERETSDELGRMHSLRSGPKMPLLHLATKAIGTLPTNAGDSLVSVDFRPELFAGDVESLRPALLMGRAGAKMITTDQPLVTVPRQDAPLPNAAWVARDGAATKQGDLGTRSVDLTPKTVYSYHEIKRSARLYGQPSIYGLYQQQIIEKQLFAIDASVLYGTGAAANQPVGLGSSPRLQSFQFGGLPAVVAPTITDLIAMASLLDGSVAPEDSRVWLMNPLLRLTLMGTLKFPAAPQSDTILEEGAADTLLMHPIITGPQLPWRTADSSTDLWLLDGGQAGICWFAQGASTIEVVPNIYGSSYSSGGIELIAFNDVDVWFWDAYRAVRSINPKTLGKVVAPVPIALTGTAAAASKSAENNHGSGRK